jgi:hypothetical protein
MQTEKRKYLNKTYMGYISRLSDPLTHFNWKDDVAVPREPGGVADAMPTILRRNTITPLSVL